MRKLLFLLVTVTLGSCSVFAVCLIPGAEETANSLTQSNRKQCLVQAHFLVNLPELDSSYTEQLINPVNKEGLVNGVPVYCRFVYQIQNGASAKFRCARTNEHNQLYDTKGNLVPEATQLIAEDDDVFLADAQGKKISNDAGTMTAKPRKAEILKIRYTKLDGRNIENYTSAAASRILWALGIPAHKNIMTEKIVCFGCSKDPFKGQVAPVQENGTYVRTHFSEASIEIKFEGKRLYSPLENSWDWTQLTALKKELTADQFLQSEVFALATHFLTFTSTNSLQNALVCTMKSKSNPAVCESVIAMSHDIGAAFGTRLGTAKGKDHPRGDIRAYMKNEIFKKGTCDFAYTKNDGSLPKKISKQAQLLFLERAKRLDHDTLATIFSASKLGRLNFKSAGQDLHRAEAQWIHAVQAKIQEITAAPCY